MKGTVIESIGSAPVYKDIDEPRRQQGQTLVEVLAAPINPIDISTAAGRYAGGSPDTPFTAGREAVGRVLESDSVAEGARVYVSGLGFLAERAVASDENVVEIDAEVDDALAACFGVAGLAAWLAVEWRGDLREGETVLVLGASGAVGAIAVQAAKLLGAGRVVAGARSEKGLERARQLGADATVKLDDYEDAGALADAFVEAADGQLNLTIDPVWGEPARAAIRATGLRRPARSARAIGLTGRDAGVRTDPQPRSLHPRPHQLRRPHRGAQRRVPAHDQARGGRRADRGLRADAARARGRGVGAAGGFAQPQTGALTERCTVGFLTPFPH